MSNQIRVGVIFGGRSGEHEVSVQSARSIVESLNPAKYTVVPILIDKAGHWQVGARAQQHLDAGATAWLLQTNEESVAVAENNTTVLMTGGGVPREAVQDIDVVIPALHGSYGEDGTVQGLLEMLDVPYVGAGVLASAVSMDKTFMKRLFAAAQLPQVAYTFFQRKQYVANPEVVLSKVEAALSYPMFVKPANLGSSVGISKAKDRKGLIKAIETAMRYDHKVIVEAGLDVREVEVAVLGNDAPIASIAGEVVPSNEFYDYRAKYLTGDSELMIPAPLSDSTMERVRQLAVAAYQAVDCTGLARVDFFIEKATDLVLVNEINTMPGFTKFSMYPKLWEATGVAYGELVDRLIQLALERHEEKCQISTEFHLED